MFSLNLRVRSLLQVTLERRPLLYVINFVVPLVYLLVLDLGTFFISESRNEKLSFKVTVLLSISVLLLILKDILPSTEIHLPVIGEEPHEIQRPSFTLRPARR